MKYDHIIFDVDGTLIDTDYAILHSLQRVLSQSENRWMEASELRFALGIPGADALKLLGCEDVEGILEKWDKEMDNFSDEITIFQGIPDVLEHLSKEGHSLGIVTSRTCKEFEKDFTPLGMNGYFGTIIRADDTLEHKPKPAPLEKYLELTGQTRERVIYVGDSEYDMLCGEAAGVDCALALWCGRGKRQISATYYLDKPEDLLEILGNR